MQSKLLEQRGARGATRLKPKVEAQFRVEAQSTNSGNQILSAIVKHGGKELCQSLILSEWIDREHYVAAIRNEQAKRL